MVKFFFGAAFATSVLVGWQAIADEPTAGNCEVRRGPGRVTGLPYCTGDDVSIGMRGDMLLCAEISLTCE